VGRGAQRLRGRDPGPTGPLVLALETGGEHLGVALWRLGEEPDPSGASWRLLEEARSHRGHRHADTVLSLVDGALERHDLERTDIALVAVGRGPGGFTGIRVGMATAGGLALGLDAAIWPVDSLAALAMNGAGGGVPVLALIDARKSEVYGAVYGFGDDGEIICLLPPMVAPAVDVHARARALAPELVILGSGALISGLASVLPPSCHVGSAAHVGVLAAKAWEAAGRDGAQAPPFDPAYVRASDAELALAKRA
jgi:tRNA threonylcarbamoyl adenosine modification protein YeaZ